MEWTQCLASAGIEGFSTCTEPLLRHGAARAATEVHRQLGREGVAVLIGLWHLHYDDIKALNAFLTLTICALLVVRVMIGLCCRCHRRQAVSTIEQVPPPLHSSLPASSATSPENKTVTPAPLCNQPKERKSRVSSPSAPLVDARSQHTMLPALQLAPNLGPKLMPTSATVEAPLLQENCTVNNNCLAPATRLKRKSRTASPPPKSTAKVEEPSPREFGH